MKRDDGCGGAEGEAENEGRKAPPFADFAQDGAPAKAESKRRKAKGEKQKAKSKRRKADSLPARHGGQAAGRLVAWLLGMTAYRKRRGGEGGRGKPRPYKKQIPFSATNPTRCQGEAENEGRKAPPFADFAQDGAPAKAKSRFPACPPRRASRTGGAA